ncbi:MAG: hypothetical protein M3Z75_04080 [Actinomycetota bacterium]|nr:hypothetical protein [Actinomycetota bacterium]
MEIHPDQRPTGPRRRVGLRPTGPQRPLRVQRRAGTVVTAAVAAAVAMLAGCSAASATSASSPRSSAAVLSALPRPAHPAWLLTRSVLAQMIHDPAAVGQLRGKLVYEILRPGQPPLPGVVAEPVVTFASAAALEAAIRARQLPAGVFGVLYDPEAWTFTPQTEQEHPVQAAAAAAAVAHAHGLRLIVAPAIDLTTVLSAGGTAPRWRQFLGLGLIRRLAKVADVVELQAQSLEQDTSVYRAFIKAAAAQASAGRPGIDLLAGLSTNPPGVPVDARQLTAAIQATRSVVGGYWLNVPAPGSRCPSCHAPRPDIAVQALQAQP